MLIVIVFQGMEKLVKEAFQHVDVIGPRVQRGMFELFGPNGEIILPYVWDKVIEPGWQITKAMWPVDAANVEKEILGSQEAPCRVPHRSPHPSIIARTLLVPVKRIRELVLA